MPEPTRLTYKEDFHERVAPVYKPKQPLAPIKEETADDVKEGGAKKPAAKKPAAKKPATKRPAAKKPAAKKRPAAAKKR